MLAEHCRTKMNKTKNRMAIKNKNKKMQNKIKQLKKITKIKRNEKKKIKRINI